MNLVFVEQGLVFLLRKMVGGAGNGVWYKLFTSDSTPSPSLGIGDLTFPAGAWAEKNLSEADFTLEQVVARVGSIQAPTQTFTNNSGGPITIYGYAILNQAKDKLLAAAKFDGGAVILANNGSQLVVPLVADLSDKTSP